MNCSNSKKPWDRTYRAIRWCSLVLLVGGSTLLVGIDQLRANTANDVPSLSTYDREFSARVIWRVGNKTSRAQLFVKQDRYRIEPRGGMRTKLGYASVIIVRLDQRQVWHVISQRRLVAVEPLTAEYLLPFSVTLIGEHDRTLIGDAFVEDRPARLYEVVVDRAGKPERYYQWVDAERGVLLRLMSQEREWSVQYEHIVMSVQPEYFFETPLGYRKIDVSTVQSEIGS